MRLKDKPWIEACWEAHSGRLEIGATALEDWSFDEAWRSCWCCGSESRRLQKCHIVPRSLGGADEAGNLVPLCSVCHDEMPDVADPEEFWSWIREKQNPLSCIGLGRYHDALTFALELTRDALSKGLTVDTECYMVQLRYYLTQCASLHGGQYGQGVFLKDSSIRWAMKKAMLHATAKGQLSLIQDMFGCKIVDTVPQKKRRKKK